MSRPTAARRLSRTFVLALLLALAGSIVVSPTLAQGLYLNEGQSGAMLAGGLTLQDGSSIPSVKVGLSYGGGPRIDASFEYSYATGASEEDRIDLSQQSVAGVLGVYAMRQTTGAPAWLRISGFMQQAQFDDEDDGERLGTLRQVGIGLTLARDFLPKRRIRLIAQARALQSLPLDVDTEDRIEPGGPLTTATVGLSVGVPVLAQGIWLFLEPSASFNREATTQSVAAGVVINPSGSS